MVVTVFRAVGCASHVADDDKRPRRRDGGARLQADLYKPHPLAELNGDEEPDVLRVGPSDLRILSGAEEFTFSAPTALSRDSTYTEIQVADLHEDIANDIIALGVTGADIFLSPRSFRTLSFNPPGQGRFAGTRGRARSGESEAPVGRGPNPMDMFHEPSGRSRARHGPVAGGTLAPNKFAFGAARP